MIASQPGYRHLRWVDPKLSDTKTAKVSVRIRAPRILLHERIEQWIVKRLEGLKALDRFRRSDQSSNSGPLASNTVAICAVADE
jgi:hypothetical protein